jgi:Polysaccharide deacetylase
VLGRRLDEVLDGRRATFFAVGADARRPGGAALLHGLHNRGHEVASHSYGHDLRLHRWAGEAIEEDLERAAAAIADATGAPPCGFRSPGYGTSPALRATLARLGYRYDASAFPSPVALVARAWFARAYRGGRLQPADLRDAAAELIRGARARRVAIDGHELVEIPVTVMPYTRLPLHASHLVLLARRARRLSFRYLDFALGACRRSGIAPAVVIHPTDLIDAADAPALREFPGMRTPAAVKLDLVRAWLARVETRFELGTVADQAAMFTTG